MRRTTLLLGAAALAVVVMMPAAARAGVCGNGVVEAGEDCDPGAVACTYLSTVPEAPVIDCGNALCTARAAGTDYVCTDHCLLTPACRPLLDDPAKITFKTRPKLDMFRVTGRGVPVTDVDPIADGMMFGLSNANGLVYGEMVDGAKFITNTSKTTWKYVVKRTGMPMIYNVRINKKLNRTTGLVEYIVKLKSESDLDMANPFVTDQAIEVLQQITIQISIGEDVFYNSANWERKSNGWFLADKYMFM